MSLLGKQLLVEGEIDKKFLQQFFSERFPASNFYSDLEVKDCKGWENAIHQLDLLIRTSDNFSSVGIMLDSDDNVIQKIKRIDDILRNKKNNSELIKLTSSSDGKSCVKYRETNFGLWFMPDRSKSGNLESLLLDMRRRNQQDEDCLSKIDVFLNQMKEGKCYHSTNSNLPKAKLHIWLALQYIPGLPIEYAMHKDIGLIMADSAIATPFADWLTKVFS